MSHTFYVESLSAGLFFGTLRLMEIGRLIAVRRLASDPDLAKAGFGAVEGGFSALLGLLLAFYLLRRRHSTR